MSKEPETQPEEETPIDISTLTPEEIGKQLVLLSSQFTTKEGPTCTNCGEPQTHFHCMLPACNCDKDTSEFEYVDQPTWTARAESVCSYCTKGQAFNVTFSAEGVTYEPAENKPMDPRKIRLPNWSQY